MVELAQQASNFAGVRTCAAKLVLPSGAWRSILREVIKR